MVAFHIHGNTSLSSEMLSYDPPRHPPENLLSYKDEVRGESGVSRHCPRPPEAAWTRLERIQHTLVYWEHRGKQRPLDGMLLPITSHRWFRSCGSSGKERAYE